MIRKTSDAVLLTATAVALFAVNAALTGFIGAVITVVLCVLIGMFAHYRRNRNGYGWFVLSLICPIVFFAALAIMTRREVQS
jgi:cell division protein FtsX